MTIEKDKIKKALDNFENDNYSDSKETLSTEIKKKINDYLKKETGVEKDPVDDIEKETEEETED